MLVLYLTIKVSASLKTNMDSNGGRHEQLENVHANENILNWVLLIDPFKLTEKTKLDA